MVPGKSRGQLQGQLFERLSAVIADREPGARGEGMAIWPQADINRVSGEGDS